MPRTARIDAPGALHHVMIRGVERKPIFRGDRDREALVDRLALVLPETQTACYAWVFMDNHAHFLFRSPPAGISHVMRRVMTGYAGWFNRRHRRCGPLFQNRFKSVLCQEDAYFKELVRYIHLNPVRARIVSDVQGLAGFKWCGHPNIIRKNKAAWQDADFVLANFGGAVRTARKRYMAFVEAGLNMGRRDDLTGGGLIRSRGGWTAVKAAFPSKKDRQKGDQRILGDGDFVQAVLARAKENLERRHAMRASGLTRGDLLIRAARVFDVEPDRILSGDRTKPLPGARSLYCHFAEEALGVPRTELGRELGMTGPGVGFAVRRGAAIAKERGLTLDDILRK